MQQQTAPAAPVQAKPAAPPALTPGLDQSIAAELAAADAAAAASESPVPVPGQAAPMQPTQAEELAGLLLIAGTVAGAVFPSVRPIYTEARCRATGEAVSPALERLNIRIPMGATSVYGGALLAVLLLGMETRTAVLRDLETMKRNAEAEAKAKGPAPSAKPEKPADAPSGEPKPATEADVLRPPVL